MLRKAFIVSFICISFFIFLFFTNLFIITKKDLKNFKKCKQKEVEVKSHSAYQERKKVKKDLYIVDNETRKHYIINSDQSEIFLNRKNQSYELIENLDKINFLCIENIDKKTNLNHIKYITANKGYYFFPSHNIELKDVNLSFVNTTNPQKIDLNNAYFKGHSNELNFTIHKKKPVIEAASFDGIFDPKKGFK